MKSHDHSKHHSAMENKTNCWEYFRCEEQQCPAFMSKSKRCWLISGTRCHDKIQGEFIEKIGLCLGCGVLQHNLNKDSIDETLKVIKEQYKKFKKSINERNKINQQLFKTLSEEIAGRRQAEADAIKNEKDFKALVKTIPGIVYKGFADWTVEFVDDKVDALTGYAADLFNSKKMKWSDIVFKDGAEDLKEQFVKALKTDKSLTRQYRIQAKNNDILWIEERGQIVCDRTGRIEFITGIFFDITEQKAVEEALAKSEQRFQNIIENNADGIMIVDKNGILRFINSATENILGRKADDLVGKYFGFPLTSESMTEIEIILEDQNIRSVEMSIAEVDWENEAMHLAMLRDITFRKHLEQDLRENEERFRALFEDSMDAIYMNTRSGDFIEVNNAMLNLFGYTQEEMLAMNIIDILADPRERPKILEKLAKNRAVKDLEVLYRKKDGTQIDGLLTVSARYSDNNNVAGHQGIIRDVTEQKLNQEKLKQSFENLRKSLRGTIHAMAITVESRDPYTAGHQQRVADLGRRIATVMGLSEDQIDGIRMAGAIHDLGKISVPAEILSKPTRLSDMEFALIKTHSQVGYDILKGIEFPWPIATIVHQHHEKLNGSGYPLGLSGDAILLEAKILTVADVVEAMASHRPYRPAVGIEPALEEITKNKGVFYDPEAVDACLKLFNEKGFKLD